MIFRFSLRPLRFFVPLIALTITVVWLGSYADVIRAVQNGAGATTFGIPLQRWQQTLTAANARAADLDIEEIRAAVRGVDPAQQGDPAAVALLIGNPPWARFVAPSDPAALLLKSGQPSLYLWTLDNPAAEQRLVEIGKLVGESTLAGGLPSARLYQLPPVEQAGIPFTSLDPPATFDAGLQLIGYHFPDDPGSLDQEITLIWRVLDPDMAVRERDFTLFNHILDAETGEMVAQVDGFSLLSRDWWPGDVIIQPYRLRLPSGRYTWRTGLYSRSDGGRASLITGGDSFDLPVWSLP